LVTDSLFSKSGLSLERLRTFAKIVTESGISKAAPGNATRQSQYSRQLKELEEFFGVELIQRRKGLFRLTSQGRELFQVVEMHFGALEELITRWSHTRVDLRVGAGESWLQWLVIPNLSRLQSLCENVTPVLHNLRNEEIASWLLDGRLDLGFMREKASQPFHIRQIAEVQYLLFIPKRLKGRRKAPIEKVLENSKIGILDESRTSDALTDFARRRGFRLNVYMRASSYVQLAEAVRMSSCAAVLPSVARSQLDSQLSEELPLPALKEFSYALVAAWPKQYPVLRPVAARAAKILTDLIRGPSSR
jgi:DNA-binding transcriptional LysR family regulator